MTWDGTIADLSAAYGVSESAIEQRVYAIAEQIHTHYCLNRGFVNHHESRPDQHAAISILANLAGGDWWMVRNQDRLIP